MKEISRYNFESPDRWIKLSEQIKSKNIKVFVKVKNQMFSGIITKLSKHSADFKCDYGIHNGTYLLKNLRYRKTTKRLYDVFLDEKHDFKEYIEHIEYDYIKNTKGKIGLNYSSFINIVPESRRVKYYFNRENGTVKMFKSSRLAINYITKKI